MSADSKVSKIQIRAQVLQNILKYKNCSMPSDFDVESTISELNKIEDKEFVIQLLLKEISGSGVTYDNILCLILYNIAPNDILSKEIFSLLSNPNVSDTKKLFLINILREQGQGIDYNFIQSCVDNPDEAIDNETKKFLEEAKLSPETLIDFYDFYFTVGTSDRDLLLESIINDYSGDNLANLLSPFAYFYPEVYINKKILDALCESKSYFAYPALDFCSKNCADVELKQYAKKLLKKLNFSGLKGDKSAAQIYSQLFENSVPYGFWYSIADGNSNISCVFARKRDNGTIQTFFSVFNLEYGPVSTFGFNEISKEDFDVVLLRFFKSSLHARLNLSEGKAIFDALTNRGWKNGHKVPYEFVCWRQLTLDVDADDKSFQDIINADVPKKNVNKNFVFKILNSDLFSSWFFEYSDLPEFDKLIDNIEQNSILDISEIETLAKSVSSELIANVEFKEKFIEKIKFQSYILKNTDMDSTSRTFLALVGSDELLEEVLNFIIKKSVYVYFLNKSSCDTLDSKVNIFSAVKKTEKDCDFSKKVVCLIEEKWT